MTMQKKKTATSAKLHAFAKKSSPWARVRLRVGARVRVGLG
jgi:hypothetical protein